MPPGWPALLDDQLERARRWIEMAGVVESSLVDRVAAAMARHAPYFAAVPPTAFLDDLTTKNVIVDRGRLSGVVDVDVVCFGDPLFTPALTRMALRSADHDTRYVDYWLAALDLDSAQRLAATLYTALFAVTFIGELGQAFNRATPEPVEQAHLHRLLAILDDLLGEADELRRST